jgi:hypothetical protein
MVRAAAGKNVRPATHAYVPRRAGRCGADRDTAGNDRTGQCAETARLTASCHLRS